MSAPRVPYTPIYRRYRETIALHDKQRLDEAKRLAADPSILATEFAESIALMQAGYTHKGTFRPELRVPRPPRQGGIANGADLAFYLHNQQTLHVTDAPELDARYTDYELSLLSTPNGAVFDNEERLPAGRALRADIVMSSLSDNTPVIGEVKVGRDKEPFSALIQLLAYIAHLASPSQYERLGEQVPSGDYPPAMPAVFDGYLLLYGYGQSKATYLDELLDQAQKTSHALMAQELVRRHVRRLVCLDLMLGDDKQLVATLRDGWRHEH